MPRGNLLEDPSCYGFVSNFPSGPLADGTLFRLLTGHRDQLADLLCADLASTAWAWDITEPILDRKIRSRDRLQGQPAFAPGTHGFYADAKFASNLAIVLACIGLQDDTSSQG